MEDDLYGGDLYGDASGDFGHHGSFGDDVYLHGSTSQGLGHDVANNLAPSTSAPAAALPTNSRDHTGQLADLKGHGSWSAGVPGAQPQQPPANDRWHAAFKEVASICGVHTVPGRDPDVHLVLETVRRIKTTQHSGQDELRKVRRREAALQMQLAERSLECLELRRELAAVAAASDPSIVQLKQLMLDPAVNKEFLRLRSELEQTQADLKTAQEELQAVTFTQESKVGRQLMAKCRSLQEENEEMGRELAEGKGHAAEAAAALARAHADDLKRAYVELEDHCLVMEEEAEELQREIFALRAHVADLEREAGLPPSGMAGSGGGGGMGGMAGGGGRGFGGGGGRGGHFDGMGGGFRGRGRRPIPFGKRPFMDHDGGGPMGGRGGGGGGGFGGGMPPMKRMR